LLKCPDTIRIVEILQLYEGAGSRIRTDDLLITNQRHLLRDSSGRTIWIADAHRDDGKRFVVRADEKLTAFVELESTTYAARVSAM
jgi:hypothetical protein